MKGEHYTKTELSLRQTLTPLNDLFCHVPLPVQPAISLRHLLQHNITFGTFYSVFFINNLICSMVTVVMGTLRDLIPNQRKSCTELPPPQCSHFYMQNQLNRSSTLITHNSPPLPVTRQIISHLCLRPVKVFINFQQTHFSSYTIQPTCSLLLTLKRRPYLSVSALSAVRSHSRIRSVESIVEQDGCA